MFSNGYYIILGGDFMKYLISERIRDTVSVVKSQKNQKCNIPIKCKSIVIFVFNLNNAGKKLYYRMT